MSIGTSIFDMMKKVRNDKIAIIMILKFLSSLGPLFLFVFIKDDVFNYSGELGAMMFSFYTMPVGVICIGLRFFIEWFDEKIVTSAWINVTSFIFFLISIFYLVLYVTQIDGVLFFIIGTVFYWAATGLFCSKIKC